MPPILLVISGLPASGKSTLGTALARELGWPLVTKDEYKQIICEHLPELPNGQAGVLSFSVMWQVAGVTLAARKHTILETHFYRSLTPGQPSISEREILGLATKHQAHLIQIFCHAPLPELERRHAERVASGLRPKIDFPFIHRDLPPTACWEPLERQAPLLRLDTTQPDAAAQALDWVKPKKEEAISASPL